MRRRFADALAPGRRRRAGARGQERGLIGFEILPVGLPMALGDSFYDPVYAAAEGAARRSASTARGAGRASWAPRA